MHERRAVQGFRRQLVIMVKEPVAGRVKTRLGHHIGMVRATAFYRHTAAAVISRLAADTRWDTSLSVAPTSAVASRMLPAGGGGLARRPQSVGDIGARMQAIFDSSPPGPVVIIGTDVPLVRNEHIRVAFQLLGQCDVVFGPALDGGFWLVGMRKVPRVIKAFPAVRWSSASTLDDCRRGLRGWDVRDAVTLGDVDDRCDLERVRHAAGRLVLPRQQLGKQFS